MLLVHDSLHNLLVRLVLRLGRAARLLDLGNRLNKCGDEPALPASEREVELLVFGHVLRPHVLEIDAFEEFVLLEGLVIDFAAKYMLAVEAVFGVLAQQNLNQRRSIFMDLAGALPLSVADLAEEQVPKLGRRVTHSQFKRGFGWCTANRAGIPEPRDPLADRIG